MDMLPITLSSKLEEGNETKKLIDDVFILIQKLHDNNIVHLDMNIQNFMIDSNGDVKIID
jgi:serine/threonine protein kinase